MQDFSDEKIFNEKYGTVKNVIVDEAQNFKDRDGDWYSLLEKLSQQNCKEPLEVNSGYFWVFMDYAQKVHKFSAGLPNLIGKNNFMLREISRNSQEIYTYARKFMDTPSEGCPALDGFPDGASDSDYHLGHNYSSGNSVQVVKCSKSSLEATLGHILKQYVGRGGGGPQDVAVLASKKGEAMEIEQNLKGSCSIEVENSVDHNGSLSSTSCGMISPNFSDSQSAFSQNASNVWSRVSLSKNLIPDSERSRGMEEDMVIDKDRVDQTAAALEKSSSSTSSGGNHPLVVSTVREFSGLDRPVIIGVDPHTDCNHADLDKFLLNLVTRAKDQLIILTTSDELMKKLSLS